MQPNLHVVLLGTTATAVQKKEPNWSANSVCKAITEHKRYIFIGLICFCVKTITINIRMCVSISKCYLYTEMQFIVCFLIGRIADNSHTSEKLIALSV